MNHTLDTLITGAIALAGDDATAHRGRIWLAEGGRACPIGWDDCSQAVFVDLASGDFDYGEPGGPGAADCAQQCPHGGEPPEPDEEPPSAWHPPLLWRAN